MAHQVERYHSLDFLRAAMMFLGILLHATLSFAATPTPFWPAADTQRSQAADFFIFVVHTFRMQTFFLLAGLFGCLLAQRAGLMGLLKHRFLRIVVPFGLALLIIQPTLQALWLLGNVDALRYVGVPFDVNTPRLQLLEDQFLTGRFLLSIYPFHLWFLYFLIVFFLLMVPLVLLGRQSPNALGDRLFRRLLTLPGRSLILAGLTAPLLYLMQLPGMVDTPNKWHLPPHLLGYYFLFFLFGWLLWRQRDLLPAFTRRWGWSLAVANLMVLPVFLSLVFEALAAMLKRGPSLSNPAEMALCLTGAWYTWLMAGGLLGLFGYCFQRERRWVRYLADASYWCYLWHLTPIIALQIALQDAALPGLVKFAIIVGVSLAVLLTSYQWGVRYTSIGRLLNGRRSRIEKQATVT